MIAALAAAVAAAGCLAGFHRAVARHDDDATSPRPSGRQVHAEGLWLAAAGGLALLAAGLAIGLVTS